jgi:dihydroflavonol-4-reductase
MLNGQRGCPKINCGFVDVRDVADLHVLAMTHPAAKGERFLATAGESLWMIEVAKVLRRRMGASASNVRLRELPNWLVRLAALRNPGMRGIATLLGRNMNATSEKASRLLGWSPRSSEEAIVATAESLIRLGLLA